MYGSFLYMQSFHNKDKVLFDNYEFICHQNTIINVILSIDEYTI